MSMNGIVRLGSSDWNVADWSAVGVLSGLPDRSAVSTGVNVRYGLVYVASRKVNVCVFG